MPETYHSSNTSWLCSLLSRKLREDAMQLRDAKSNKAQAAKVDEMKYNMLCEIYRYLVLFLGEPPTEFSYRFDGEDEYKQYTPQSFFKEFYPNYNASDYVMLMNDPSREYYKLYEIEFDRNVLEGKNWIYVNLPAEELKSAALASLKDKEAIYSSCDVSKFLSKTDGTLDVNNFDFESLLGMKFGMDKATRIKTFDSGSSHAMLLMAVDVDNNDKPTKWQFENSWGSSYGHNGYLTFTDEWFSEYMFRIVVNKKYLSDKIMKVMKQTPIVLPPWDPMFAPEE
ncbi:MAG: aminopeptidase, partial [Bacteroidales bacterium]|nr:aminopeptidase [Bacteroidales bacterium]